jgi:hypothetical protein
MDPGACLDIVEKIVFCCRESNPAWTVFGDRVVRRICRSTRAVVWKDGENVVIFKPVVCRKILNSGRMKCEWPIAVMERMRTNECGCVYLAQSIDQT